MHLSGRRLMIDRWIFADTCVVRVQVEAVILDGQQEESLEPGVLDYLDDLQRKADLGLVEELKNVGDVYVRQTAA